MRHQKNVVLACVAVMLALATAFVIYLPTTYTAAAAVLLSPAPGNPLTAEAASAGVVQMTVALETEAQLIRTPAVAEIVSDDLGRLVPDSDERLVVTVPSNTQMLEVSYTAGSAERAREGAQGFAEGYLAFRAERAAAVQETRIERLNEQLAATDISLRAAIVQAGEAGASAYESQQVQLLADRLAQLSNSVSAEEAIGTDPGTVISDAALPTRSNGFPKWLYLGAAAVLGLVVGLGIGLLREWRRDLLRESDNSGDLGIPVLAQVHLATEPVLAQKAGLATHESYRRLRTAVIANGPRPYVLAVTGLDTDLSAEIATNLSIVFAEAKFKVLLVSTDTQERSVERLLGVERRTGLAEVVLEGASARELLIETRGISLLTAGVRTHDVDDLTATSSFRALIDDLHQEFDYVVIAAGPAGSADGDSTLLTADSALLVLTPGATRRTLLVATMERLARLGVATIGTVNAIRPTPRHGSAAGATAPTGMTAHGSHRRRRSPVVEREDTATRGDRVHATSID